LWEIFPLLDRGGIDTESESTQYPNLIKRTEQAEQVEQSELFEHNSSSPSSLSKPTSLSIEVKQFEKGVQYEYDEQMNIRSKTKHYLINPAGLTSTHPTCKLCSAQTKYVSQ
jgi:hypothetical protein